MTNIIFTTKEAKEIKSNAFSEANNFIARYLKGNDILSITLKSHLYIEGLLNILILNSLNKISKNEVNMMKFSTKIKYLDQLGYSEMFPLNNVIGRLKALNRLRNSFAHKIDYEILKNNNNLQTLIKNINIDTNATIERKLKGGICGLLGYIEAMRDLTIKVPFISNAIRNKKLFLKDPGFSLPDILKKYKELGLEDFLQELKS